MKNNIIKFGEDVEGYAIPVLNEREIRAAAGIQFLILFIAFGTVVFQQDFLLVKYVIIVFLTDFIIRVFISPRFSPLLIIGRIIVSRQQPEYVGAPQKKFAWVIGLVLSGLMFFLLVILNAYSIVVSTTCFLCLAFLFFESSFGICLGCIFYRLFYKEEALLCSGAECEVKTRQTIQKLSGMQLLIAAACIFLLVVAIALGNDYLSMAPRSLKTMIAGLSENGNTYQFYSFETMFSTMVEE